MSNYVRFPVATTWRPLTRGPVVLAGLEPAEAIQETPPPGGAAAAGFEPTVQVAGTVGGATAAGPDIAAATTLTAGGATAQGVAQNDAQVVTLTIGGALAAGTAPAEVVPTEPFDRVVAAVPRAYNVTELGSRLFGPIATEAPPNTPTPGGAEAAGAAPTVTVPSAAGGAAAAGSAPAATTSVPQGGATAGGQTNAAQVPVTPGGGTAGGQLVDPLDNLIEETPVPGGGTAGGTPPAPAAAVVLNGATAAGVPVTLILVPLTPGGATGGGNLNDPLGGPFPAAVTIRDLLPDDVVIVNTAGGTAVAMATGVATDVVIEDT